MEEGKQKRGIRIDVEDDGTVSEIEVRGLSTIEAMGALDYAKKWWFPKTYDIDKTKFKKDGVYEGKIGDTGG